MIRKIYATASAITDITNAGSVVALTEKVDKGDSFLASFGGVPTDVSFKEIFSAYLCLYLSDYEEKNSSSLERLYLSYLKAPFDPNTVTENSKPSSKEINAPTLYDENNNAFYRQYTTPTQVQHCLNYGIFAYTYAACIHTTRSSNKPYLEIECSEESIGVGCEQTYPVGSATISSALPTTFSWKNNTETYNTLVPVTVTSTKLRWRYSGSSAYTEIDVGTATSYTVPANTFGSGIIEWQVETTANSGAVRTTPWTAVSAKEPLSSATINYPKNIVLDGSKETTFSWNHIIANGTKQTAFDLQTSANGTNWTTMRSVSSSDTFVTFPAGTFTAGDLYWRVRTYNLDNLPGSWSEAAHIIVIAAPEAPGVTIEAAEPSFSIRWQQTGQQAYEITLDGETIAKRYGTESNYQYDGYLKPGTYEIRVRIQNQYGMWSDWGLLALEIENFGGAAITLTAEADNDMVLTWNTEPEYSKYILYRDGVKLGETTEGTATDHFALGAVTYQVRGVYADSGNYTLSNEVRVNVSVKDLVIADVENPRWLNLALSTSSLRTLNGSETRSVTYTHYVGEQLPFAELGEAAENTFQLDCAWKVSCRAEITAFEALAGKTVCIKTPGGRRVVGVMGQYSCTESSMLVSYQVPITQTAWEDNLLTMRPDSFPEVETVFNYDALIDRSITEVESSTLKKVGKSAFEGCTMLAYAEFPFATSVEASAFEGCTALTTVSLARVQSIAAYAFRQSGLRRINMPQAASIATQAFQACNNLRTAIFPAATSIGSYAFENCSMLQEAEFPLAAFVYSGAFQNDFFLEKIDFPRARTIDSYVFRDCSNLTALILRRDLVVEISSSALENTPIVTGSGYIYVPSALLEGYLSRYDGFTFGTQFRAIEDYPSITGG